MDFKQCAPIVRTLSRRFVESQRPDEKYLLDPVSDALEYELERWFGTPSEKWPTFEKEGALPIAPGLADDQVLDTVTMKLLLAVWGALSDFVRAPVERQSQADADTIIRSVAERFGIEASLLRPLREHLLPVFSVIASGRAEDVTEEDVGRMLGARETAAFCSESPELEALKKKVAEVEGVERHDAYPEIVGKSRVIRDVIAKIERLKGADSIVLITGETGTGKEVVAEAIHRISPRRTGPFIAAHLAGYPAELVEDQLFGHVKGAFAQAFKARESLFEQANGGTLFLDEIGDLELRTQVRLLRVLQTREFQRIGDNQVRKADVRVIAATNRNLQEAVRTGDFRQDLFYRLSVFFIHVPPLRERKEDIPMLARHFLEHHAMISGKQRLAFSDAATDKLLLYDWPGNVRELDNCVERAVILAERNTIRPEDIVFFPATYEQPTDAVVREEEERERIIAALRSSTTVKKAAPKLGWGRSKLYEKCKVYGIDEPRSWLKGAR